MSDAVETGGAKPAYGRFSRRLQAVVIDSVILALLVVAALLAAVALDSDHVGRILGVTVIAVLLLYEPLLVALTGSTIGHHRMNLRVVDNRSHGNITFVKAVVRAAIKAVLGIYSFVTMATSSRHQAVHDLLTGSTVQIRDLSRARARDHVTARTASPSPAMASAWRRLAVILAYLAGAIVAMDFVAIGFGMAGLISQDCFESDRWCSPSEHALLWSISLALIGVALLCIVQGWRGRLYGCRLRRPMAPGPLQ